MSIIAIKGVPQKWNLIMAVKYFKKAINGPFEALNFGPGKMNTKTLFISLSETMDPVRVIENINKGCVRPNLKLYAYVPSHIPDFPLARKRALPKGKRIKIEMEPPYEVIQKTHHELLQEIQYKYPGLYNLSRKTGHKLLDEIAQIIFDRLKDLMGAHAEMRENCFKLSSNYRKNYPHYGDFQMILKTLHAIQDASGAPRLEIQEKELLQQSSKPCTIENIAKHLRSSCNKYNDKILNAITSHIRSLDAPEDDTEYAIARKKVIGEMRKMLPYMPLIVRQVTANNFIPQQTPLHKIRIYGEPFLPSKDAMSPFVQRYHAGASRVIRHQRMYNLLLFKIAQHQLHQLLAMDGSVINGAKLRIRTEAPTYVAQPDLRTRMATALGAPPTPAHAH